jgi:uncharacterized membrane protein YbhN (UPF0104 family)
VTGERFAGRRVDKKETGREALPVPEPDVTPAAAATTHVKPRKRRGGWIAKVAMTVVGLVLAYLIFSFMSANFGGFEKGVQAAFSMPPFWTAAAIIAGIFSLAVYPLTAQAAIPGLGYEAAFVDRQGGFAISTTIPFGGGAIAVGTQYSILARYGVTQKLAAAAVAADAIWTYLMTFGAPGIALTLLWLLERRAATGDSCGEISCEAIDLLVGIAGVVCLVSIAAIAFVLRSRSNAKRVGDLAQGILGWVFGLIKRTPPNAVDAGVGFNDTAAEMVRTRWLPITLTNLLAQIAPMFVILAALQGVGATQVTVLEVFVAYSVALLLTTVPLAPGGAGTVDAALIGMLVAFGADYNDAVAADIIWRAFSYLPQMVLGWIAVAWFTIRQRMSHRSA